MNKIKTPNFPGTKQKRSFTLVGEKADKHHTQKDMWTGVTIPWGGQGGLP